MQIYDFFQGGDWNQYLNYYFEFSLRLLFSVKFQLGNDKIKYLTLQSKL